MKPTVDVSEDEHVGQSRVFYVYYVPCMHTNI